MKVQRIETISFFFPLEGNSRYPTVFSVNSNLVPIQPSHVIDLCQFSSFKILTNQSSKDTAIFWWMVKLLRIVNIKIFLYFCALIYYILLITVYWISNWYHVYKIHGFTHSSSAPVNIGPASHKTVKLKKCLNKLKCIVYIYIVTDECRFNFLHCRWFDKLLYTQLFLNMHWY